MTCGHCEDVHTWGCAACEDGVHPGVLTPYCGTCDHDPDCKRCARKNRARFVQMGTVLPFYVVAYGTSRHYGGGEEGGWWWDRIEALAVRRVWGWKAGLKAARELREEYPTQERNRFSVLGNGQDVTLDFITDPSFIRETLDRPRYE